MRRRCGRPGAPRHGLHGDGRDLHRPAQKQRHAPNEGSAAHPVVAVRRCRFALLPADRRRRHAPGPQRLRVEGRVPAGLRDGQFGRSASVGDQRRHGVQDDGERFENLFRRMPGVGRPVRTDRRRAAERRAGDRMQHRDAEHRGFRDDDVRSRHEAVRRLCAQSAVARRGRIRPVAGDERPGEAARRDGQRRKSHRRRLRRIPPRAGFRLDGKYEIRPEQHQYGRYLHRVEGRGTGIVFTERSWANCGASSPSGTARRP